MKVVIVYHPQSEQARAVETFITDFKREHGGVAIETVSLETREGDVIARNYDITSYPGILALRDDGGLLQIWQGSELPLMSEVASYSFS